MKLNYYPETDSLYIDLSSKTSSDSLEISEGIVVDYDKKGNVVGIDIDNTRHKMELKELILTKLPLEKQKMTAWLFYTLQMFLSGKMKAEGSKQE